MACARPPRAPAARRLMVAPRSLRATRYSKAYTERLRQGWRQVRDFTRQAGWDLEKGENDLKYLNELLVCFVQWAYNQKWSVHAAKHGILSCQVRWPHTKGHLKAAWESLRSWALELPVGHRTPLTSFSLHALCFTSLLLAAASSCRADADSWLRLSVLLRVGFHGLLRPPELVV